MDVIDLALASAAFLLLLAVILAGWIRSLAGRLAAAHEEITTLKSARQSQATRYGQITEQFAPFMASWPWDPKAFRFLGDPIDGIQFTDDAVILVEIKSASSRLSARQQQVRDLVAAGRVRFEQITIR